MKMVPVRLAAVALAAALLIASCAPAAPTAAPTQVPAAAAQPTAPAPAAAPTKGAAAQPIAPTLPAAPTQAAAAQPTAAQPSKIGYPEKGKTITIIVPWAPGSVNDVLTRLVATYLEKDLGAPVQVVDKPGGGTQIGLTELTQAKSDGYTLAFNSMPTTIIVYADPERKAAFGRKDFQPVAVAVQEPMAISVAKDSPFKNIKDLVDAAKVAPEKVKVGDGGFMIPAHMAVVRLGRTAGVKFASVHFNGDSEVLTALIGGHIDAMIGGPTTALTQSKSGALRVLGITDKRETKLLPGVQPLTAQGYDVAMLISRGYVAPGGTPKEIVDVLSAAMKRVTDNQEFRQKTDDAGLMVNYLDSTQYAAQWDEQEKLVGPMIGDMKAQEAK